MCVLLATLMTHLVKVKTEASLLFLLCRQTMDQKVGLFILLAAGLLCLSLVPVCRADDEVEDIEGEDLDVDVDDELEMDAQDEVPPAPKTPPAPKVRLRIAD